MSHRDEEPTSVLSSRLTCDVISTSIGCAAEIFLTILINYRTGQKGSLLANFLSFQDTILTADTGASVMIAGTERMKWWFYHGVYDALAARGYDTPDRRPPPTITWEQQRQWFQADDIADIAFEGMLGVLSECVVPVISMQHLPMLKQRHIDILRSLGHDLVGITTKPERIRQIELENHFKTADRPYITPPHKMAIQQYLASKNIPCADDRPELEIDAYCAERDLSPTDENRILVMQQLITMSNRPNRATNHTVLRCNDLYAALGIRTIDYDDLYHPPYGGIKLLDQLADTGRWADLVRSSWVPPKVVMFGKTWDLAECGYNPQR